LKLKAVRLVSFVAKHQYATTQNAVGVLYWYLLGTFLTKNNTCFDSPLGKILKNLLFVLLKKDFSKVKPTIHNSKFQKFVV